MRATGLPDFDRARWHRPPRVRDVLRLREAGVLRQSFDPGRGQYEVKVPPGENHVLLWVLGHEPGRHEALLDGRHDDVAGGRMRNAYLLPVGLPSTWRGPAGAQHDCLHFHFSRRWVEHLVEEGDARPGHDLPLRAGIRDPALDALIRALLAARRSGEADMLAYAEHWSVLVALRLLRLPHGRERLAIAPWRLARALAYAEAHFGENISLADLAQAAGLSRFHFARAFQAATGETPHAHLRRLRCERAQAMMLDGQLGLADIALACGFAHQAHFTTAFRRVVGTTPGRWREERRS
jgi:AraC-like DNA-binding protein